MSSFWEFPTLWWTKMSVASPQRVVLSRQVALNPPALPSFQTCWLTKVPHELVYTSLFIHVHSLKLTWNLKNVFQSFIFSCSVSFRESKSKLPNGSSRGVVIVESWEGATVPVVPGLPPLILLMVQKSGEPPPGMVPKPVVDHGINLHIRLQDFWTINSTIPNFTLLEADLWKTPASPMWKV